MIEVPEDGLGFIVMEEWSSQLIAGTPRNLDLFLQCMRQCIENLVFMHKHHIAHLDISLRNLLTDYKGHYAYIDFELSHRYPGSIQPLSCYGHGPGMMERPRINGIRGTEIPPELDCGGSSDPFKVDIWALGVLILRSCKLTGYYVPELMQVIEPMLAGNFEDRPTAQEVLVSFDRWIRRITPERLAVSACS
jgi:serine/threonine protein kinase